MQKRISHFINKYNTNSIFFRYSAILVCTLVIPILIIAFAFFYRSSRVSQKIQVNSQCSFYEQQIPKQFSEIFGSILSTQNQLLSSPELYSYLYEKYNDANSLSQIAAQLHSSIKYMCMSSVYLDSIYIYSKSSDYILSNYTSSYRNEFPDTEWINESTRYTEYRTPVTDGIKKHYLSFITDISSYGYPDGFIVYNIDCTKLPDIMYTSSEFIDKLYIMDSTNRIIYSNDEAYINKMFNKSDFSDNIIVSDIKDIFYTAFTYNNDRYLDKSYISMLITYSVLIFAIILLSLIILSKKFFNSFFDIIELFENQPEGIKGKSYKNEFQFITENISSLLKNNKNFETELVRQYNKLKKTQILALQNQINPHFIFNTLNAVTLLDMSNNGTQTEITTVIQLLSDILRATIYSKNYIIELEQEALLVQKFIKLENIKYGNIIDFKMNIPESAEEMPVLKFMLQPIVENSIKHGILKTPEPHRGFIRINAAVSGGNIIIKVTNSGSSISSEKLNQLNASLSQVEYGSDEHIGLLNVNSRIKLLFGDEYGCKIDCTGDIAEVTITLPANS